MPTIEANGQTLNYTTAGDGPAILFIHSMGADVDMWRDQFAAFGDRYRCVAFDCRGHGGSSYTGAFSVGDLAADCKAGIDALGIADCHLVGLAMGGPIAISFAAAWPEATRSLTVADAFVDMRGPGGGRIDATAERLETISMAELGREYAEARLMPDTPREAVDQLAGAIARVPAAAYIDTLRAIFETEFTAELSRVRAPALVIYGDQDEITPLPHSRQIADGMAGSRLEIISGAGHISNLDRPEAFNALVAGFLDALPR